MTESPKTTLTRQSLLSKVKKPRYEVVEVEGLGSIGIRERTRLQASQRAFAIYDPVTGSVNRDKEALQPFWRLIDQVMVDEDTPMFKATDLELLCELPESQLDSLFAAVQKFNETAEQPKKTDSPKSSSES